MEFVELNWKIESEFPLSIVGIGMKPADQFHANPYNPKVHPAEQRKAVRASLSKFGWANFVIENKNTGNVLDGHERIWESLPTNSMVPYVLVDIPAGKEGEFLIAFDKTGFMAEWDYDIIGEMRKSGMLNDVEDEFGIEDLFKDVYERESIDEDEEEEEFSRGGMIIYFFFETEEEFKRVHRELLGYEFDGEGFSVSVPGNILSDKL